MTKKPKMTAEEKGLKDAAKNDKEAAAVYSDWLEEHDRYIEAAKWRKKAGLAELRYEAWIGYNGNPPELHRSFKEWSAARAFINVGWIYRNHYQDAGVWKSRRLVHNREAFIRVLELKFIEIGVVEVEAPKE